MSSLLRKKTRWGRWGLVSKYPALMRGGTALGPEGPGTQSASLLGTPLHVGGSHLTCRNPTGLTVKAISGEPTCDLLPL